MATTTPALKKRWRRFRRVLGPALLAAVPVLLGLAAFAVVRPLTVLWTAEELWLWLHGIRSENTEIPFAGSERVRVHYFVGGEGEPLVLVHGLGGRAEDWAQLMPKLTKSHRVYALDLPGYGRSEWPRDADYSIEEETQAVEAFMDKMRLDRTDLAGWSMGGWIAMQVALDRPEQIRRLVILDSAGIRFDMKWDPAIFAPDTREKLHRIHELLVAGKPPKIPGFIADAIFRYVRRHGWVVRRGMDSMLTGQSVLDEKLHELKMPMLIVWGQQDHLIPVSVGERIHQGVPQSEMVVFSGCGHLAPSQCASRVAPVVNGFLDEPKPMPGRSAEIR